MSTNANKGRGGRKRPTSIAPADPHAERESTRYERPIASREFLQELLSAQPLSFEAIIRELGYEKDPELQEALDRRLRAMRRDGQAVLNRNGDWVRTTQADLIAGSVIGHPDGFGFLRPDAGGEDIFLHAKQMRGLLHGDRALVQVLGVDRRGKREGRVVEVLERMTQQLVGRYLESHGVGHVLASNKRISQEFLIPLDWNGGAKSDEIVLIEIIEQPTSRSGPVGKVVEVLGDHMAPGMEIDVAIRAFGIPHIWPDPVEAEANAIPAKVTAAQANKVKDLRALPLVTIDGEDARDFDDAVYAERNAKGWKLYVAIAHVSHYVQPDSPLDREAQVRGNSVYFPGRVVPMLPEALSNGICSLNPKVDRLCMVCEMQIDEKGRIQDAQFHEAVMHSKARLTYTEVAAALAGEKEAYKKLEPQIEDLRVLHDLWRTLHSARNRRGAIDFETIETKIEFGLHRKIERVVPVHRNDAHKMIEECMIAANVATARFLDKHKMPTLYRVHEQPPTERLDDVRTFLAEFGLALGGGESPTPLDYSRVLQRVQGRPEADLVQTVLLRSLSQAVYSPEHKGHFGLALEHYAHFTSPIRRYPDLLVHRAIRHILNGGTAKNFTYSNNDMERLGAQCSMTERRADDATRDAMDWLRCEYMQDKVGSVFTGVISGVTGFGLFVTLDESRVDGLVHVTTLDSDYYRFDPIHHRMVGERSGRTYRLGDPIAVQVARVDLDERKIDFVPEGAPEPGRRKGLNAPRSLPQEEQDPRKKERESDRGADKKASAKKKHGPKRPSVKSSKRSSAAASRKQSSAKKAAPKKAASKKKARKKRS
jgi:ribonuclease R